MKMPMKLANPRKDMMSWIFMGFGPVLDGLILILGHREAIGRPHIARDIHRSFMESHLSARHRGGFA